MNCRTTGPDMKRSLIYKHIYIYRFVMNLIYVGRYRDRFMNIINLIGPDVRSLCDLCFGDTIIAERCRSRGIHWTGIDLNHHFCRRARKQGFNAIGGDLFSLEHTNADVYIMAGSLYHFHTKISSLFDLILSHTNRFILSEPIQNLSSMDGMFGWWAKHTANPGSGNTLFRYNKQTLLETLRNEQKRKGFEFRVVSINRDILVEINY